MFETLRKNPTIEEAPLQGELMLFDPKTARFFVLNRTMAYVWRECESRAGVAALVDGLLAEFAGATDTVEMRADVEEALKEMVAAGLVTAPGTSISS